jgi:hypothetical protein
MLFLPALCLIFVAAKLLGLIAWSWWLVFMPVLIPGAIMIFLLMVLGVLKLFDRPIRRR